MLFSDFLLPDFESGTVLDSIQLRLSLAAKTKNNRGDGPQRFLVEYTYDTGTSTPSWLTASVLDIDDEISNSINGGYFLLSLNAPPTAGEIANLQIKVTYQGNVSELQTAFVEGMWLEVTSGKFYESGESDPYSDELTYGRDLLAPELNTLNNSDLDPTLGTLPQFTLSYDPQQGFFNRLFRSLFSENTFLVERITLTDSDGGIVPVPFVIEYHDDETWTMKAEQMPQKLRPGKYLVEVEILENDERYTDTFEFYWGVLAVNTKKSMYFPNEDVQLNLAALTDKGDTICNANLELKIIDPKNNIFEVPVEQSGACGPNNVTDIPDYLAKFTETGEWGEYTIQLQHKNEAGEVVHKITDSFEVRDYIPFDIERTAPTRIYPPAPYDVSLKVKAYRDFTGDINERVPRGFIIDGLDEDAVVSTLPEYTLITWKDVTMKEGDERTLSYTFDAPDISPYLYLLGPLDMDGFAELRQWQIASDALGSIGWFRGTRTVGSTNLNNIASAMEWSTSSIDSFYFTHSTTSSSQRVTIRQAGDYYISVNVPQQRTDATANDTRVGVEVRINGVAAPQGLGRSAFIGNAQGQNESSGHSNFMLTGMQANDYVEVFVSGLTTINASDIVTVTGQASMFIEYIPTTSAVFAATTTATTNSTNLNQVTAYPLSWTETRQDSGFVHSDTVTPQNITLSNPGTYLVQVSVPLTSVTADQSVLGRVLLNGTQVSGGIMSQGYIAGVTGDNDASIHWSGVVVSTTTNQVLTISTEREGAAGTTTVPTGFSGSIFIQSAPASSTIILRGRALSGGTDWSNTPAERILWDTRIAYDATTFTHSTTTNSDRITIASAGDYLLTYNDAMTSATANANNRITVTVSSTTVSGARTQTHYISGNGGHNNSSGNFDFLLEGLTVGQFVQIYSEQEGRNATLDDTTDAIVTMTKKAAFNQRPDAPTMYNTPFDNIRFASTTPYFEFITNDPDGTSDIQYEFAISTSSDFATATVRVSGTDAGFLNTASSTDTSPYLENNKMRFQLQAGDVLSDLGTYYWRVRAKDATGSGQFGDWSTTQSLTVDLAATVPDWYQSLTGQFESNTLVGAVSSNDSVEVAASVISDVLLVYGEGVVSTPRYRLWNGTSWSVEANAVAVSNTINWVATAAGVTRDEYALVTLDQSNDAYAQIYSASTSSWGNQTLLSNVVSSNAYRGVAVAYESLSGDAMAVSCTNGPDPVFRIWNGTSWSATSTINANSVNNCNYISIASNPASDEIIVVVRDTGTQYEAFVWSGTAWVDSRVIGSSALVASEGMAVEYESSGDQAVITVSNNTNASILYTTWNGTEWSANTTQAIGNDFVFGRLKADPNSDKLILCYIDADADIGALRWDGGVWSTFFELTTTGNAATGRPVDCDFETLAGLSGNIMAAYGDTGVDGDYHRTFATSTWSAVSAGSNINDAFWVQTVRAGNGTIIGAHLDDETDRLDVTDWNGTSWSSLTSLETSPSSVIATPYEMFSLTAKRFQFTQGVVRTPVIQFSYVSNQTQWGDISFDTTEPFGTDVLVRVKYTASTTCDTYVPNLALPGNSTGFDVSNTPIDLTGVSTTTYSQICLEATITTLGSASASLDDWTLSWVRKPKLIQQAYRWYVNGSFLTPTDAWPLGGNDVAESTVLNSGGPVNLSEEIRLRMSLRSSNVSLPISTSAFKLQYAAGITCSPTLTWADVGSPSSSTALWRGYNNGIGGGPDGTILPSRLLSESDVSETYEETNPTNSNASILSVGNDAEWDFSLENNGAVVGTNYCFRMVYDNGATLNTYTNYPRLITNAAPLSPITSAPFDNEQLASTTPWFEFSATDEAGDVVSYEIEVDTDYDFSSPVVTGNSVSQFVLFTNLVNPAERSQYTSGQTIRFVPSSALSNNTTYWWRVRATDDFGANTASEWSTPSSFRVATATAITTWFQTTGEQFDTNSLIETLASTSTNDIAITTGGTVGTTTSTVIDYDDRDTGNAWGALAFTDNESSGTIDYFVEFRVSGETFALVPDADLAGNSSGFNTSPVSLINLNTDTYNELRIRAEFAGTDVVPRLLDWTVTWGNTIEVPTLVTQFDNAKVATTTPTFTFYTSDPENNDLEYEFQLSTTSAFTSSSTFISGVNAGFSSVASSTDTTPFSSGTTIQYALQSALTNGSTYWWRVRARDPLGSNTWSSYATAQSFTIDTALILSTWYQTTGEQFLTNTLVDIESTAGAAQITSTINEVLMAYGEGTGQAPRYRKWSGTAWSNASTAASVGAPIRWTQLKAAPTRPEYALGTLGTDSDVNVQIYAAPTDTWANVKELETNVADTLQRGFDVAYESTSGDLIAVSCRGLDAVYSVWNGSSWSATSSISLTNTNNCLYIEMASDPVSDEIIAVFKHTNTSAVDYETLVWNGSSWGNSTVFGDMVENTNEGIAVEYEESGGQAIVALSNGALTTLVYNIWNGSSWAGTTTTPLGDHIEWASLKRDNGSDALALCYIDNDTNIGVIRWTGSAWSTFDEIELLGNSKAGQPIDCEYETLGARDGYLLAAYSDTGAAGAGDGGKYQVSTSTTYSGELDINTVEDSWRVLTTRGGDGTVHAVFFDDTNDRYDATQWNGTTWSTRQSMSGTPSITGTPFDGSLSMAAQVYPNFTAGSILSTAINFTDGSGPRWEQLTWNDTTPGASTIRYRVYYETASSTFERVPDVALVGNTAGFTTSPVSLADLDRTIYDVLKVEAELVCDSGSCPSIQDWSLEWAQGISVSGTAYEYNGTTTIVGGTVAVAVNGVLQVGKTGVIGGAGTWSITNVTAFDGDTITVFIDGAADSDEAIGITTYDGTGNVTQMELSKRTITFGSTDTATTTTSAFGMYDTSDDEDVFFSVTGSSSLLSCGAGSCSDAKIKIKSTALYEPGGDVTTFDFTNEGEFMPDSNTIRVGGSWSSTGTFLPSLSTVIFTATTSARTITSSSTASSTLFHNVTFGETSGTASWTLSKPLDITGTLAIDYGTLARATNTIYLEQNLRIGVNGTITGLATTTFDGSGSHIWTDNTVLSTNLGHVVIDGTAKTITLGGNVTAQSITIGSDDTLNASGSGYNISLYGAWTNNNSFIPQSGTVNFIGTTTSTIARGSSAFNNLTFNGVGGAWSFSTSTLVVNNNFTIATGTVTMPTGTTTIAGNFTNSGGTFLHNNGEVRMTSTATGKTITQRATAFLNAFYDLVFTGSGAWSYTESAASTTRNYLIQSGTVTMPSTTLMVGGDFTVSGSGVFTHNSGEVILLLQATNTVRTNGSSFNNLRTRGTGVFTRTFADTNATILGNLIMDTGGVVTFPTGVLSVGGSFDNNATFNHSSGTVSFNSATGAETIAVGTTSSFATVEFNNVGGNFTLTESATATVAINLTTASQFTLQSGLSLASLGTFTNAVSNGSTTWTGSTLSLSGADGAINVKTHGGDTYGTLRVNGDTDMIMWNSSAATYSPQSTASIYSADHAAVDGDLNIYGDYARNTGTEYWSYATDFDGTALTASTSRQVDVRIASSSRIGFSGASLNMVGGVASTTVDTLAGSYELSATTSTITASNFTLAGMNSSGLQLNGSTTLASFQDGFFTVATGRTGITISSTTVSQNPAAQYSRISFATTTAGAATNVTMNGTSSSFVWFRLGIGNLYGEAYDANDGNPGSVRFDDSSNTITISGVVYADDGVTPLGAPTCNGTTPNVRVVVNDGTYTASTTCAAGTGAFTLSNVAYVGDPKITVYLNTNGGVVGTVVTKTPTANITNLDIYANRVITRHQDVSPLSISDMTSFDFDNDSDIKFVATTTGSTTLQVLPGNSLFVFATTTFAPGGNVTLFGNASSSAIEGTLQLGNSATFTATGTETHTLAGRLVLATTSTLSTASSTFVFNATTTGKSITSPNTLTFNNVQFTGVAGGWNITAPLIVNGNMDVSTGTVTGTNNLTLTAGSLSGNGTLSMGTGTTTINQTNTFGGTRAWSFNNLVLGSGLVVGTTTRSGTATTTILGRLTISTAHFVVAGNSSWDLAGTGTVFTESGTFNEDTSTVRYSGGSSQVLATTYYNLDINAGAATPTYTATGIGIAVTNNLTVGGTATTIFDVNTNDPVLTVGGSVTIQSNGTLSASNVATTSVGSNFTNLGTFTNNGGIVAMVGGGSSTIAPGSSSFATLVINNGAGSFTVSQPATTTNAFTLLNHANFTLASGQTMAIGGTFTNTLGGAATTFSSSTLSFYGAGTKTINDKSVSDSYHTLVVASGTNVKMWNSSAVTFTALGGVYSQDHAGVDGKLNIYGTYAQNSGTDYWSYATDFDGVALGGSGRQVDVALASGANVSYTAGGLEVVGTSTASTTLANQGSGTYGLSIAGTASTTWDMVVIRNTNASGTVFTGTPIVNNFSRTDHQISANGGTGITVGGSVIDTNQAKNFTNNIFATSSGITSATNVTATGTSVSSWRFTNHQGALSGEAFDSDPAGDPGYLVWDNSAALITVSGNVYSDEGSTVSTVCNGVTQNIVLRVAGLTTYTASCNGTTGLYSIPNVAFSPSDTLTVYIDGNVRKAVTVSADPVSSISNMHLYENRVIVRHENTNPLSIADMAIWDSSDDADILFTAVDAGSDTLTLPADQKLVVWTGKTFEPNGNVTLSGGGAGGAQDGTLEAQTNATFRAQGTEAHSIGGSMLFGSGATYTTGQSTTTFTTTGASRTIDVNSNSFYNVAFTGAGSYTVSDVTFTTLRSLTQTNGAVTFGSGTTTIGASFNATAGSFTMAGTALVFTSTTTGNIVRLDDSNVPKIRFEGTGGAWSMTDTNATTTGSFTVASGTVTLPTGNLAVAGSFDNSGGTIVHNTADLIMSATTSAIVRASSSSLFAVRFTGVGPFTLSDVNLTLADSLTLATGTLTFATGTLAVAGDFLIASGTVNNATGTVLFNATTVGKTVQFGSNALYNVVFGSGTGGWNFIGNATTTNNFSITGASSFTKASGTQLNIGGVFTNTVGGVNTTWTNTTLRLYGTSAYTLNTKTTGGDVYGTLDVTSPLSARMWNSSAATTTVINNASLYSQDHNAVDGALNIYGNFGIATTTEYWSYATDFDGTALVGAAQRQVNVRMAPNATTTMQSGGLQIIGTAATSTTVATVSSGTYAMTITGGTFDAQYYSFTNLNASGVAFSGSPTITNLANGYYVLTVAGGTLLSVSSTTLDANASKIFSGIGFATTSAITGTNVTVTGSTSNAWRLSSGYGNLGGEAFDSDGATACGSIRFDNSGCLITQQTHYRWRNNDGGEGAPASEWLNTSFDYRQRVRVVNTDTSAYASTAVKIAVTYDSSMQSDFDDLRFTSSDGVTAIPYWIERYTASTDAVVWVRVPNLPASDIATVFMYYGSSTAPNSSNGSATFSAFDDFEDNNITEYSGDTSLFQTDTTPVYGGTYALEAFNKSGRTTDGIFRTALTVSQGQIIRWMQYMDATGSGDDACTLFGVQSPGTTNNNYAICLEKFGIDRFVIAEDVDDNDSSGTVLASSTATYATGWYEVEVDWRTNNTITAYLRTAAGALIATASTTDASYTAGGMGFTFWFQNGSWDSFTARPRALLTPTVYFGAEQTDGGATWEVAQNTAGTAVPGSTKRLRFAIENSGLDVTNQTLQLEYAAKGVAASCEAVSSASFAVVPNQASCGSSPVCMQTSTQVADNDPTTDHLGSTTGMFSAGTIVESPSNITSSLSINQNKYTELEYVLTPTMNASTNYCFRVTNGGTPLDFYNKIAELTLQFDPVFGAVTLNNGAPITLTPNATTSVYATGTVTDFNGVSDIVAGSSTIYRSGAGAGCAANDNNCYKGDTTSSTSCSFINCSGNTCTLSCRADIYFHADSTDTAPYEGEEWMAYLEARDASGGYDFASALGVELLSLRAATVNNAINYGTLSVGSSTGATNATTTVANVGNTAFNIELQGTDLSDGGSSRIPADQQKFATTTFNYSACVTCGVMSSTTPTLLTLGLAKPTVPTPPVTAPVYWGIAVPTGVNSAAHSGINVFTPVSL
ncbi:MAG: DUF2341 domain-containing protein [Patescibacteria group bacterium]